MGKDEMYLKKEPAQPMGRYVNKSCQLYLRCFGYVQRWVRPVLFALRENQVKQLPVVEALV
jgi:hypothetical protein